jgi:caffeoyl-CoA O-methyltransferase
MRKSDILLLICLGLAGYGADSLPDAEIDAHLKAMQEPGQRFANIEAAEGAYLQELVKKVNAKKVLEIGTSTGYSGIWMARGLRETGGRLISIEIDQGRHRQAVENFRKVGLRALADLRLGDALQEVPRVEGPLDLVFIDALKSDYLKYYEMVLPKMRPGGIIVAHNVESHPQDMQDFLQRIRNDPKVKTEIVKPGWQGFSVSVVQ